MKTYQAQTQKNSGTSFQKGDAKSILELINQRKFRFKVTTATGLQAGPGGEGEQSAVLKPGTKLKYLDYRGEYIQVEVGDENGNVTAKGWVKWKDTDFDAGQIIYEKTTEQVDAYDSDLDVIQNNFVNQALKDYNDKKGSSLGTIDKIPDDSRLDYYEHSYQPFADRFDSEVKLKQKLGDDVLEQYEKFYSLRSIFDVDKMTAEMDLDKDDPAQKQRKFVNSRFPEGMAAMSLGAYPSIDKGEDASDMLNMGGEWIATMEVLYAPESKEKLVNQITLDYPLQEFINQMSYITEGSEFSMTEEQLEGKMSLMAIMMAHEFIHTAQNTMLKHQDIAKLPGLDSEELKKRKAMRELLAYHFTAFPNQKFENAADDPVFSETEFVRGETARFGKVSDLETVFFIWKALDYLRRLEKTKDTKLMDKYKVADMKRDFLAKADEFRNGPLAIEFDPQSETLQTFFATQDPKLDIDRKYMNYLRTKQ